MIARILPTALLAVVAVFAGACETGAPHEDPVDYEDLYEREAFWPYHVELSEPWRPEGFEGERFGHGIGVLVRVERSGLLRVDFARFGQHLVPAEATDVLERANRIRTGEKPKQTPNFVLAVVNKLFDPSAEPPRNLKPPEMRAVRAYLLLAADPGAEDFARLVASLPALDARPDAVRVLFPQGGHPNATVLQRCREAGWNDPVLHARFVEGYTRSIFGELEGRAELILQTPEGRVFYASEASAAVDDPRLREALAAVTAR